MNKRNLRMVISLVLTILITACSEGKVVKTKETKEFTKGILVSKEKEMMKEPPQVIEEVYNTEYDKVKIELITDIPTSIE